jgi:predicted transcriptional regulator
MDIATKEDLIEFKNEILQAIKGFQKKDELEKGKWIKSKEVMEILKCSPGTLQNLKPVLKHAKLNGTLYFDKDSINEYMNRLAS